MTINNWNNTPNIGGWQQTPLQIVQPIISGTMPQLKVGHLGESFKPKRAGKKTAHIVFLLDDSASMQSCRDATIAGYNEYLDAQKADSEKTNIETFASLYKFDGRSVRCVFDHVDIKEVEHLTKASYNPQGTTNLYDGIGGVMMSVNNQLAKNKKADRDSVIITILTDGAENSSRTFNNVDIKQMVEKAEGKDWGFMFLGANVDAFAVGGAMGFSSHNTLQYDTANMVSTMSAASNMTTRLRSAYASGASTTAAYATSAFTAEEQQSVKG